MEMQRNASDEALDNAWELLHETRPTAINLRWALDEMRQSSLRFPRAIGRRRFPQGQPRSATPTSRPTA
jgi:methylthioribose-1-phosphate isomerase